MNLIIEDLEFENDSVETGMWNPFHYAVYHNNFELIKFFLSDMKINVSMTLPKSNADSEKDAVNAEKYQEDKILTLLRAYDRANAKILKYLLDELYMFWPLSTVKQLLEERFNNEVMEIEREQNFMRN